MEPGGVATGRRSRPREPRAGDAHRRARDERRRREEWAAPQLRVPRGRRRLPWTGAIFDPGAAALDRHDGLAGTASFKVAPTLGVEQAIVGKRLWLRAGLDETTWAVGPSVAARPFKPDIAVLRNLAAERTGDVFGKSNVGAIATLTFDYLAPVARSEATKTPGDKTD